MIVVIADDLTGAAELGGLGLKYGLKVEVVASENLHSTADLLVISADTRSMEKMQAVKTMSNLTSLVKKMRPALIYKKVDSVMRGHVIAELSAQMKVLELPRALLVPANPRLGRTIFNGNYFIHDRPIHLSSFSSDPEFPIVDSRVLNMLGGNSVQIQVKKKEEELPETGIAVGEASTTRDVEGWAAKADRKNMLLAGAADFFEAILARTHVYGSLHAEPNKTEPGSTYLFVCGSTFDKSRQLINDIKKHGGPVSYMPLSIANAIQSSGNQYNEWCSEVVKLLSEKGKAIIAIDERTTESDKTSAKDLREKTAVIVSRIMKRVAVSELIIEGGSTASAIIRNLGFTNFFPVHDYTPGVVRMKVAGQENLHFTLKPGSYNWPDQVWDFDTNKLAR
jgi:D-threonate/D-erythronate kinase